ncbi:VOC family protein [Martelella sp. HB161492]|uniref:VOC family protein n=1 Tax=Martelella sp. HB161492 TaxID=2720726 RepID=UPI001590BF3E|nr:VOC family protein [Martelella sp. HB161492]
MRWRGVNHIELSVLDYERSVAFFDEMFGWLGYKSFWTLDLGYRSTYYMARFPFPHSYIGIQPARSGGRLDHEARATGLHHLALWATGRREVDRFHRDFLLPRGISVSDPPAEYPLYAPGYYAVFFDDPVNGFHLELAHIPLIASPGAYRRTARAWKQAAADHPDWPAGTMKAAFRTLPGRTKK